MIAPPDPCPARGTLLDFNSGRLAEPDLETVAEHLTGCDRCLAELSEIQKHAAERGVDAFLRRALGSALGAVPAPAVAPAGPSAADATATGADPADRASVSWNVGTRPEDHDELVGTALGPYHLLARLGAGGMGVVYRAAHEPLRHLVALKTLRGLFGAEPDRLARFRIEGAALARLSHPNVVRLYHFDDDRGRPYFTMELVDGGDLAARLEAGPLACRAAAELVRAVAGAVAYLHAEQVVHRDLKPHNVLLAADGAPKVSDLGLAKLLDGESDLTETGQLMGTPEYMSPEQAEGITDEVGSATDVYALGAILYACLTGRAPFKGETRQEVLNKVRTEEPVPPKVRRPDVPGDLDAVCLKCLEKDRHRRYASAEALAADLDRWLRGEPTLARPLTRVGRVRRWARRNARRGATALVLVAIVGLAAAAFYPRPTPVPPADPDAPDPAALTVFGDEAARGNPVRLVPETGRPRWWQWRTAGSQTQTSVGPDGTFRVSTWGIGLLELLPDPGTDRFRLSAQIRHEQCDETGAVGLYCGRSDLIGHQQPIDFFIHARFDDVKFGNRPPPVLPPGKKALPRPSNRVDLSPRVYGEAGSRQEFDRIMGGASGHEFEPTGGGPKADWHELGLVVTPGSVLVEWDGRTVWTYKGEEKRLELTAGKIDSAIQKSVNHFRLTSPQEPFAQQPYWPYTPRGGLGLFLDRGQASFRSVTLTPLPTQP